MTLTDKDKDKDKAVEKDKATPKLQYRYSGEISQMCSTFGEASPIEDVVQSIEDIVRTELGEMVLQARAQATRRGARHIVTEDIFFLVRHDRFKLLRLRSFLSWREVRRGIKESQTEDADYNMNITEEPTSDNALTVDKVKVPLAWDVTSVFSEHLDYTTDIEDEDEAEVFEGSKVRLKEADDMTRNMTSEQYAHYSESRQASFVYRKAKRFRDFLNIGPHLDGSPNDEVLDVLGFLAHEMVRTVALAARAAHTTQARARLAAQDAEALTVAKKEQSRARAKRREREKSAKEGGTQGDDETSSPSKRARRDLTAVSPRSPPRVVVYPVSLFSEPVETVVVEASNSAESAKAVAANGAARNETIEKEALEVTDVTGGHSNLQQVEISLKGNAMRKWQGGRKIGTGVRMY